MNHATSSHDDDAAVALRGASLAFHNKPTATLAPQGQLPNNTRDRDAFKAANSAGRARSPLRGGGTNSYMTENGTHDVDVHNYQAGSVNGRLHPLGASANQTHLLSSSAHLTRIDPKNPSFIAATLAASRSVSPSPNNRTPRRIASVGTMSASSSGDVVDSGSIAPTGSLISMFEQGKGDVDRQKKRSPGASPGGSTGRHEETTRAPTSAKAKPAVSDSKPTIPPPIAKPKLDKPISSTQPLSPPSVASRLKTAKISPKQQPSPLPARSLAKPGPIPTRRSPSPLSITDRQVPAPLSQKSRRLSPPPTVPRAKSTVPTSRLLFGLPASAFTPEAESPKLNPSTSPSANTKPSSIGQSPRPRASSPRPVISQSAPEVLSPKPKRFVKSHLDAGTPSQITPRAPGPLSDSPSPSPDPQKRSPRVRQEPPTPPLPRGSRRLAPQNLDNHQGRFRGNSDSRVTKGMPSLAASSSSHATPSPASSSRPSGRITPPSLPKRRESIVSAPPSPTHETRRRHLAIVSTSNLQLDSLTSAIVAGSIASSRLTPHNTGTALPPPGLPKRQKSPRLLQTLRQPVAQSEEDAEYQKRYHRHKLQSGKHSHHEGSRKRWREQITDRERKHYEAVWASNRGVLLTDASPPTSVGNGISTASSECVVNMVVREVWKRSRLPLDELEEVWDLVDRDRQGVLNKQEFVVGMWLIDQRLRGRKIPTRVSDSVWGSANGMRVKGPKTKQKGR